MPMAMFRHFRDVCNLFYTASELVVPWSTCRQSPFKNAIPTNKTVELSSNPCHVYGETVNKTKSRHTI